MVDFEITFSENLLRVERETRLRHDKENLEAEIEELKVGEIL